MRRWARFRCGRWRVEVGSECRDKWLGVFGPDDRSQRDERAWRPGFHPDDYGVARHVYVCVIPCVVIHAWRWLRPAADPTYRPAWAREAAS
jgi:hypothetical protein